MNGKWGTWARDSQEILGSLSLWRAEDTHVVSYTPRAIRKIIATQLLVPKKDPTMAIHQMLLNHPHNSRKQVKKKGSHPKKLIIIIKHPHLIQSHEIDQEISRVITDFLWPAVCIAGSERRP